MKNNKILKTAFNKHVHDLCAKDFKMLMRKMKEYHNKWRIYTNPMNHKI